MQSEPQLMKTKRSAPVQMGCASAATPARPGRQGVFWGLVKGRITKGEVSAKQPLWEVKLRALSLFL